MGEYLDIYLEEAKEHLQILNECLLQLEKNSRDEELVNSIFRAAHTIKGSSAAMGFSMIQKLTHNMEDLLQVIRDGKLEAGEKIITVLFACHDFLEMCIGHIASFGNEAGIESDPRFPALHQAIREAQEGLQETAREGTAPNMLTVNTGGHNTYLITVVIREDCMLKAIRAWMTFSEIEKSARIIKSRPPVPTEEEFKNGGFKFDDRVLEAAVSSRFTPGQLYESLDALMEIEQIKVEPISQDRIESVFNAGGPQANLPVAAVLSRLRELLLGVEINVVILETEPDNHESIITLYKLFDDAAELSDSAGLAHVSHIARETLVLLKKCRDARESLCKVCIDLTAASCGYMKKLCEAGAQEDAGIVEEILNHIDELKNENCSDGTCKRMIGEILVEKGKMSEDDVQRILEIQKTNNEGLKFGQIALRESKVEAADIIESLRIQEETIGLKKTSVSESTYIRIAASKIDSLVDMAGELLTRHSLVEQQAKEICGANDKFINNIAGMSKIIKNMQNLSMSLRMVSLKSLFQKMQRIGRDTAIELNKNVEIAVTGEDTGVDRSVSEKLLDPLMHLVRNAISHGIEEESDRLQKGKPPVGQVRIKAYSRRGNVYIEVEDDGRGLDVDKIYSKARERNLVNPNTNYTEEEIARLVFLPGFSTRDTIDTISGRGVGMNVVETEIIKIGGKVEVVNRPGQGCTFILRIPLHIEAMNGTIVSIRDSRYIVPTVYIKQFLKPQDDQWVSIKGKRSAIRVRDEIIPVIPVSRIFGFEESGECQTENIMVVILELEQKLKALPVCTILGRQELVAKPIGNEFSGLGFASGVCILGDGRVSLILDVEELYKFEG